jgi:uncharacterized protein (DUF433 family)
MLGKPVIRGTRLPVEIIVEKVAYGATIGDLRKDYPFLKGDDIRAALLYAAKRIANEEVYSLENLVFLTFVLLSLNAKL